MSAATDLPPVVFIPPQARPRRDVAGAGRRATTTRALRAVPMPPAPVAGAAAPTMPLAAPTTAPSAAPHRAARGTSSLLASPPIARPAREASTLPRAARRRPTAARAEDASCLISGSSVRVSSVVSLTTRGRLLLWLTTAAIAIALLIGAWLSQASAQQSAGGTARSSSAVPTQVVVQPGDTLWSIAGDVAPDRDPRAVVDALERANHLRSPIVSAGQVLQVALA